MSGSKVIFYTELKLILVLLITVYNTVSALVFSQHRTYTEISLQQAIDTAFANNLLLQNAKLQIDYAKTLQKNAIHFDPVEITYQRGQINSPETDYYLQVNQNFGSIVTHVQMLRKLQLNYDFEQTAYEIMSAQFKAEVKSAYLFWQYQNSVTKLKESEVLLYEQLAEIAGLQYEYGDIMLLQKAMANTKVSEVNSKYLNSLDDLAIAELKLQQLLSAGNVLLPFSDSLQIYEITKTGDSASFQGKLFVSYFNANYSLAKINEAIVKAQYFPQITAGFFNQEVGNDAGLYGWQIGLAIPIWIYGQQAEIGQSQIKSEIALNELEYNTDRIYFEIENLLYHLNKYFRQIRHYQTEALPQADLLLRTATSRLEAEEINFTEFLESVSLAMQIKEEYLSVVNQYNQTVLQLEIYEK